ncbi:MAG: hypothetical protein JNG88_07595 [Phycisphaerales bacterium]|nr:hypothetical protein [Phycisphaerales bacterium]
MTTIARLCTVRSTWRYRALLAGLLMAWVVGCEGGRGWTLSGSPSTAGVGSGDSAATRAAAPDRLAARPEHRPEMTAPTAAAPRAGIREVRLNVLHVQVPQSERERSANIWNHVDENPLGSEALLRLSRNGVRIGVGRLDWWDAIKTSLDAIEGVRVSEFDPIRLQPNFRLGFDIDRTPREQTIFVVADDGILTGSTFQQCRNVLCLSYVTDVRRDDRIQLTLMPEVRQRLDGWQWVTTPEGVAQLPKDNIFSLTPAGFTVPLEAGQFLALAPNDRSEYFGLVGGRFLTEEIDGRRYDSMIFMTVDFTNADADRNNPIRR